MTLPLEETIRLACQAEALAFKPGNVHPGAEFDDLAVTDFLNAAAAAAPGLADAASCGVGRAVFAGVEATRRVCGSNVNLGICLLVAPCAAASESRPFRASVEISLSNLTREDADWAYRAIRLASPGGLGRAPDQDVEETPSVTLRAAMALAAARDSVAAQYANGFREVEEIGVATLAEMLTHGAECAIQTAHLRFMASTPDSLIARKCGAGIANESARRARDVLEAAWPRGDGPRKLMALDAWLREDGHRRNPGTTADLIAASLFVALRWKRIDPQPIVDWVHESLAALESRPTD